MKKEDFLKICRSKASKDFSPEEETFLGGIGEAIEKAFELSSVERSKKLAEITEKLGGVDEGQNLASIVRNLSETVSNLEEKARRGFSANDKFNLKKALEAKKDDIQRARNGGDAWSLEFRAKRGASALMTTSTVVTGAQAVNSDNVFDDLDITVIQYPKNFILDAINSRQVAKVPQAIRRKEQKTVSDGVIGAVGEGAVKTLTDKSFTWVYDDRVKYAGRIEMTEEVEIDFEQLVMQIITMFEDDVIRAWNNGILTSIVNYASSYTSTGLDGTLKDPDMYSVIGAGIAWIQNNEYEPDVIAMNPADVWAMNLTQDLDGNYKYNPLGGNYAGLTPYITNKIAAGKILIGTKRTIKEQHGSFIVRKGTHGDQFIENESTIVGEIFSILSMPTLSKSSWLYLDIETVKAALLKPSGN